METIKGNLRNISDNIIKIRIRNKQGIPQHSAEFRLNDRQTLLKELRLLKEKFGVDAIEISDKHKTLNNSQIIQEMKDERTHLEEWRKKSKGLRVDDEEFKIKAQKI